MGHVAHVQLLIALTTATGHMISADRCYYGACGMHVGATSAHNSDGLFGIGGPLLLPPTMVMGCLTPVGHCYYGACSTRAVSTTPIAATGRLTSVGRCYYDPQ
jgi:hypothetical protein